MGLGYVLAWLIYGWVEICGSQGYSNGVHFPNLIGVLGL
jgi:hypothetical protein